VGATAAEAGPWTDDPVFANALAGAHGPDREDEFAPQYRFGMKSFKPFFSSEFLDEDVIGAAPLGLHGHSAESEVFELFSEVGFARERDTFSIPVYRHEAQVNGKGYRTLNVLGIKWEHRLSAENRFAVSAGYGDSIYPEDEAQDTVSTMASLSWTHGRPTSGGTNITGRLFVGDEAAKDEAYRHIGRRYYGVSLGGSMGVFENHTPYISFKLQQSDYDVVEPAYALSRDPELSRVSAGWNWQVRPNWNLRAQADYTLDDLSLELNRYDRSRILFSTRFDFR